MQPVGSPSSKPEGLPEQFWDAEAGSAKFVEIGKTLNELTVFKAQADSARAAVPEKPDGYEFKVPASVKLPDGFAFTPDPNDPLVSLGRQVAHRAGLDQTGFDDLVGAYIQHEASQAQQIEAAKARHREALGPQGQERINAAKQYVAAHAGPEDLVYFDFALSTKGGIEAIERMMRRASMGGMPPYGQSGRETGKPEVDRSKMTGAERYFTAKRG